MIHAGMKREFYWTVLLLCLLGPAAYGQINLVSGSGQTFMDTGTSAPLVVSDCAAGSIPICEQRETVNILYTVTSGTATFCPTNGGTCNLSSLTVPVGSIGQASAVVESTKTGNITVTATEVSTGQFVTFSLTVTGGFAVSLSACCGSQTQSAAEGTAFAPLQVQVLDPYGNVSSQNLGITFTAPTTEPSGTFSGSARTTATESLNGVASVPFTADNSLGSYTVKASATCGSTVCSTTFALTNVVQVQYQLTVTASPPSEGSVTVNPGGSTTNGTFTGKYNAGTSVTLTAAPASGYVFVNWGGALSGSTNPQSVTMNAAQTVTAVFAASVPLAVTGYPLTSSSAPLGITSGPDGALWFTEFEGNQIGRITTAGALTEYPVVTSLSEPESIASGSDGALWFTEKSAAKIGRITTAGAMTEYPLTAGAGPLGITSGPDGALWFTEYVANKIGRITTSGSVAEYPLTAHTAPQGITSGPDGALWFTEYEGQKIGRITTAGAITEYSVTTPNSTPQFITPGPDGALWFTDSGGHEMGRITTSGSLTAYPVPNGAPDGITPGPDGALWFTDPVNNSLGRIATDGTILEYPTPAGPQGIVTGPDGALWFTEELTASIGRAALPQADAFFTGQQFLSGTVYYLQFQDGTPFGYYGYLQGSASTASAWIYHFDLGYEYVTSSGTSGDLYLYDEASTHWWYSNPSLFPYLFDFTLNAWLYYFPNTQSPGHYTTNPRYFSNLTTGNIITM
jgi:virginiamycin B lyase